jgi:glycosyltransferase involved in cell wall biosynthesis
MLFAPINKLEKKVARMTLGTKTTEYFAAGLPLICNAYCGGAAKLIDNHGLGITYFPENVDSIKSEELLALLNTSVHQKCQEFALKNFDYSLNARKYFELYKLVLNCQ